MSLASLSSLLNMRSRSALAFGVSAGIGIIAAFFFLRRHFGTQQKAIDGCPAPQDTTPMPADLEREFELATFFVSSSSKAASLSNKQKLSLYSTYRAALATRDEDARRDAANAPSGWGEAKLKHHARSVARENFPTRADAAMAYILMVKDYFGLEAIPGTGGVPAHAPGDESDPELLMDSPSDERLRAYTPPGIAQLPVAEDATAPAGADADIPTEDFAMSNCVSRPVTDLSLPDELPLHNTLRLTHYSHLEDPLQVQHVLAATVRGFPAPAEAPPKPVSSEHPPQEVDTVDASGLTALHWAADRGISRVIFFLLARTDADPTIRSLQDGWTPLHGALLCRHDDCARLLIGGSVPGLGMEYDLPQRLSIFSRIQATLEREADTVFDPAEDSLLEAVREAVDLLDSQDPARALWAGYLAAREAGGEPFPAAVQDLADQVVSSAISQALSASISSPLSPSPEDTLVVNVPVQDESDWSDLCEGNA
ncbi:hypothetical protein H696_00161 [Fonticula alba]|uniref:Uncharacterized protein n=1 Tax=Fonticula alba TaxID=691883 RepID=A0A058ZDU7_FONAL|nr:hypothetical protein H696_00161 [Fonticula alba]KCV72570.1 hypothetical protein H696_00161 [Fonticula alba]|eukprot:XP_009492271.1 hypothetical protein H696_00161 [Fonticula alba]